MTDDRKPPTNLSKADVTRRDTFTLAAAVATFGAALGMSNANGAAPNSGRVYKAKPERVYKKAKKRGANDRPINNG